MRTGGRKKESWIGKKYPFRKVFRDVWNYAEGYRGRLIFYLIILIIVSLVSMAPTYLYGRIIDDLTIQKYDQIYFFLILTVISHLFYQIVHNFTVYKAKILAAYVANQARIKTFNYLFSLDYEFYETHALGQLFQKIATGARNVSDLIRRLYSQALVQAFSMIFSGVFLFAINWVLGIFALFVAVIFYWYSVYAGNRLVEKENLVYGIAEKVYSKVFDFFMHIQIVKFLNIKNKLLGILDKSYMGVVEQEKVSRSYERQTVAISKLILELSTVGSLFYIAVLVMDGSMSIGIAVMVFGFFTKFTRNAMALWGIYMELIAKRTGMYRMSLIYENKPKIVEPKDPKVPKKWKELIFSGVTFIYPS
ncbi:ABC transporter ATP-binding protein/permease, partial [Candidatus Woesearchaeota archaeon]|nr:ABC transporter ATP-binding protein/permease [Candidatus Woesearchaeota archaeon]